MSTTSDRTPDDEKAQQSRRMYLRFGAMILTSMVVMYAVMFLGSWEWSHVRFSESRLFMTLTMGGAMVVVMMAWMLGMYRSTRANIAIIAVGALMIVGGVALDRTQATVQDASFMSGMIPHHSLAITRSERSTLHDVRVCELAVEISEAQRREISEMEWLIADIAENGPATSAAEAGERRIPDFSEPADRTCPAE